MPRNGDKPATKNDLEAVRQMLVSDIGTVRQELKSYFQAGLQGLRSELKGDFQKVAVEVAKTNLRMDRQEERLLDHMRSMESRLIKAYESSAAQGKAHSDKALTHAAILGDHGDQLKDHALRISNLETRRI